MQASAALAPSLAVQRLQVLSSLTWARARNPPLQTAIAIIRRLMTSRSTRRRMTMMLMTHILEDAVGWSQRAWARHGLVLALRPLCPSRGRLARAEVSRSASGSSAFLGRMRPLCLSFRLRSYEAPGPGRRVSHSLEDLHVEQVGVSFADLQQAGPSFHRAWW